MNTPILSFCIPVFNQILMVERLVKQILQYKGDDIEIVISDDCSSEDILGMLNKIGDSRIKYFRNNTNLGHDLNILKTFSMAKGLYGFLLRTRDGIVSDSIKDILAILKNEQPISYFTGEAIDEDSNWRIRYRESKKIVGCMDCLEAHYSLYVHPSGSIYNIGMLNLSYIEQFLIHNIETKYSFIVHNLIRSYLSLKGNFYIFKEITWIYTNTEKSKDVAVNKMPNGNSVYSSELILKRYEAEFKWLETIMSEKHNLLYSSLIHLYGEYLYQITWGQRRRNRNPGIVAHYQIKLKQKRAKDDMHSLHRLTCDLLKESSLPIEGISAISKEIKKLNHKNAIWGRFKYIVACVLDSLHLKPFVDFWRRKYEKKC